MPHIFFENLESRRSTQTLYGGYSPSGSSGVLYYGILPPSNNIQPLYGAPVTYYGISDPYPSPSSLFPSWGSGWGFNPYMPYNTWSSPWSSSWSSPWSNSWSNPWDSWSNPFSGFWGGIANIFSPLQNIFGGFWGGGFYGWQQPTSPLFPGGTFPGEIRPVYGIPANPTLPTGSYSPSVPSAIAIYSVNVSDFSWW